MEESSPSNYEQFLLFHSVFKRLVLQTPKNQGLFGKVLNSLTQDKILAWSNRKAFAEYKYNAADMTISLFDKVENIVGDGQISGEQHFLVFQQCLNESSLFQVFFFFQDCMVKS